jgi:hypothetical protein
MNAKNWNIYATIIYSIITSYLPSRKFYNFKRLKKLQYFTLGTSRDFTNLKNISDKKGTSFSKSPDNNDKNASKIKSSSSMGNYRLIFIYETI